MHFFIAYFLSKISKFAAETSHIVNDCRLFTKHDKFGSNFVLIKQNLPNSIILPLKNGGFKARSHSVRKANCTSTPQWSTPGKLTQGRAGSILTTVIE